MRSKKSMSEGLTKIILIGAILVILLYVILGFTGKGNTGLLNTLKGMVGLKDEEKQLAKVGDCTIRGAYWEKDKIDLGQPVSLNLKTDGNCNNEQAVFTIWEYDKIGSNDLFFTSQPIKYDASGVKGFATKWKTECDELVSCQFYFMTKIGSAQIKSEAPMLEVTK